MPTIRDIARVAGVSISTVSHVVNKTRYVSPALVSRVEQAIASFDAPPNFVVKKKMSEQTASAVRPFVTLINTGRRDKIFEGNLENELSAAGLTMLTLPCTGFEEKTACLEMLKHPRCAGVVFWAENNSEQIDPELLQLPLPGIVAGFSDRNDSDETDAVFADIADGTHQAILHLLRSGHEQIAFLGLDPNAALDAYRETVGEFGIPYSSELVFLGLDEEQLLFSSLDTLFQQAMPPTALFVAQADIVVPLLRYLEANNIRCPEDVSIVCLGDFDWASLYKPAIATIPIGRAKMAKYAAERLKAQIVHHKSVTAQKMRFPTKLFLRASTAGIPRGPFGERGAELCDLQLTVSEKAQIIEGKHSAAISFHYTGRAFDKLLIKGLSDVFRPLGINIIATADAHFDPVLQSRQLESFSHLQPSIVVGMPTDDSLTSEPFRNLMGASKLVFLGHVPQGFTPKDYVSCISVNDREYGRYAAQALVEQMHHNGVSNVGMLVRGGHFFATHQRDSAAEQLFSERSDIKLCGIARFELEQNAYTATLDLMRRHPEISGLYVSWEGPAMEALRALQELGRSDVTISTCDLEHKSAMVFAAQGMIQNINAQRPYEQGRAAAMAAVISLLGRDVPSYIAVEPVKITHTNLLKMWQEIYKEEAPADLRECLRQSANYTEPELD
ncbi:MAG: LacI family DNA-binding transcriptional regulator [Oscillospiraceae bacterium]|nr:LacI family DNA-binding transcriptional regulator [Oscillospiraceae bacterium]